MGLEKAIQHKKERRKPYKGSASFDRSCRNHGSCSYCVSNRTHAFRKELHRSLEAIKDLDFTFN